MSKNFKIENGFANSAVKVIDDGIGIPLNYIKQIQGMTGVVTAVYDTPVGEVWELDKS